MIIGVTGTIGSGKSSVCQIIKDEGYLVLDADQINHELMAKGSLMYDEIIRHFGTEIIDENGEIVRSKLRKLVFEDDTKRKELEMISYKHILNELQTRSTNPITFWEVPLLFESGWNIYIDICILVTAYQDVVIERVEKRSGLSVDEIKTIISKQMSVEEKIKLADYVVTNNGDMLELKSKVRDVLNKIV